MSQPPFNLVCAVLAGGRSTRMAGQDKRLLPWGETTLLEHAVANARASSADHVLLVTRTLPPELRNRLSAANVHIVEDEAFGEAMSASVRRATREALALDASHVLFALADMPKVNSQILDTLISAARSNPASVIRASHEGKAGNPVILPLSSFSDALLALEGDKGARSILNQSDILIIDVECGEAVLRDVDTLADYQALKAASGR